MGTISCGGMGSVSRESWRSSQEAKTTMVRRALIGAELQNDLGREGGWRVATVRRKHHPDGKFSMAGSRANENTRLRMCN